MRDQELWQRVMERFPKIDKERTCRMEREMRNSARESFYARLINEKYNNVESRASEGREACVNSSE